MKHQLLQVEVTADEVDVAVEQALAQLDCTRAEVDVEVLQASSSGLFGLFGKRPARVRINLHDRGVIARQITQRLLLLSDLPAEINVLSTDKGIKVCLTSLDPSRLIGRHGQTLDALQTLVASMTDRLTTDRTPILLDVDGYRDRRHLFLKNLASRLSRKVLQTGKPASTPPLVVGERRILHEMFKQQVELVSSSQNHEGGRKTIVVRLRG